MRSRVVLLTAIAPALWGTTYVITTELLPPGRPLLAAGLRALPAGLVLVATTRAVPRGRWWWRAAVLGGLNFGLFFALLFTAAYRLPGGVAATVGAVQPLIVLGLAVIVLGERTVLTKVLAGVVGVIGVGLLVLDGTARLDTIGVAAALAGATSMAAGTVLVQRWGSPVRVAAFAGWQLTAGGLMLLPIALLFEGRPETLTAANLAGFGYLATIGGALAYMLWFRGIEHLGARNVTFLALLSPVVATVIGVAGGDRLAGWQVAGALAVLGSVVTVQLLPQSPRSTPAVPEHEGDTPMTTPSIHDPDAPIVCTLNHQDLDDRVQLLNTMRAALTDIERSHEGLLLRFPAHAETSEIVRRFADDEKQCCRFWGFAISTTPTQTTLRWDGPPGASDILDQIHRYLEGDDTVEAFAGLL